MIKVIIFDNNGVLTSCDDDTTIPRLAKYFNVDTEYLRPIFHEVVRPADLGEITTDEFLSRLMSALGKSRPISEIHKIILDSYQPKPEMQKLLGDLREQHRFALLTNFIDVFDVLNETSWHYERFFRPENIFVSSKLHLAKPDKAFYRFVLDKLGCKPDEAVFIDDREPNITSARIIGLKTILFRSPAQCRNGLELLLEKENV